MIKKLIAVLVLSVPSVALADVDEALQNICKIVEVDDKSELRKKLKIVQSDYRLKLPDYYDAISCGGKSLLEVAFINGSLETGTLLIKKLPRRVLQTKQSTLKAYENTELSVVLAERL